MSISLVMLGKGTVASLALDSTMTVIQLQRLAEAQQQPQPIWRANAWQQ